MDAARWRLSGSVASARALSQHHQPPEIMQQAARGRGRSEFAEERGGPIEIGVYANAFITEDGAANELLHSSVTTFRPTATFACDWAESGATLIGGCCGIGATHPPPFDPAVWRGGVPAAYGALSAPIGRLAPLVPDATLRQSCPPLCR